MQCASIISLSGRQFIIDSTVKSNKYNIENNLDEMIFNHQMSYSPTTRTSFSWPYLAWIGIKMDCIVLHSCFEHKNMKHIIEVDSKADIVQYQ